MLNAKRKHLEVEMYLGLPGAGKDTAIAASMSDGKDRAIICRDDIRIELGYCGEGEKYLGTNEEENKVTEVFNRKLKDAAEAGKVIVLNNMNNRRKYRDAYKQMLKDYNVCWKYIYVEASELSKNIERRNGQIHELAFRKMVESFEFPTPDEYDVFQIVKS
jgi:predicted kinase